MLKLSKKSKYIDTGYKIRYFETRGGSASGNPERRILKALINDSEKTMNHRLRWSGVT